MEHVEKTKRWKLWRFSLHVLLLLMRGAAYGAVLLQLVHIIALAIGCNGRSDPQVQAIAHIKAMHGTVLEKPNGEIWVYGLSSSGKGDSGWTDADFAQVYPSLLQLPRLDRLELSLCEVGDPTLKLISQLQNVQVFWMQGPSRKISDMGLQHLMRMRSLKELNVAPLHQVRWTCLERIHDLSRLETLEMFASAADDQTVKFLGNHPTLKNLRVSGTQITSASAQVFATIPNLESLSYNKSLDDSALLVLSSATHLRELRVAHTKVTSVGVAEFKRRRPDVKIPDGD